MTQILYDNDTFFQGYKSLRESEFNLNDLLEQPSMIDLLPDLTGKTVLDLGCGYGRNCIDFIKRGASKVIGIDISQKMLEVAKNQSYNQNIEYICGDMNEISKLNQTFDLVYSSLAFHYIEDFKKLSQDIFSLLNNDGHLLYSQEHPIITATLDGNFHWNTDENGNKVSFTFSNYSQIGMRKVNWIIDSVVNFHRPMGEIVTTLAHTGFVIEDLVEPTPKDWAIEKFPAIVKEFLKPNFLIIKARK